MASKDSKRCVDNELIGRDLLNIVLILLIIYVAHIIGAPVEYFIHNRNIHTTQLDYSYGDSLTIEADGHSFVAIVIGLFSMFIGLIAYVVVVEEVLGRYYPSCADLKKRKKERD